MKTLGFVALTIAAWAISTAAKADTFVNGVPYSPGDVVTEVRVSPPVVELLVETPRRSVVRTTTETLVAPAVCANGVCSTVPARAVVTTSTRQVTRTARVGPIRRLFSIRFRSRGC